MEIQSFKIVACPFSMSDLTEEYIEYGMDEEDALRQFRLHYPLFRVERVEQQ